MDAPRDFLIFYFCYFYFSPNEQRAGGGGGALPDFFFFFFPCSADHERDWPPCKVVFFGLATNALNVRNNNNNNHGRLKKGRIAGTICTLEYIHRATYILTNTKNISVQYNGGLLLTQCYYHRGTRESV